MYEPLYCRKCGLLLLDKTDIANLAQSIFCSITKNVIDCPHCHFRWGLVAISDPSGWLLCLTRPEELNAVHKAISEAWATGATVRVLSRHLEHFKAVET